MARETAEALGKGLTEFMPTIQALAWQMEEEAREEESAEPAEASEDE